MQDTAPTDNVFEINNKKKQSKYYKKENKTFCTDLQYMKYFICQGAWIDKND